MSKKIRKSYNRWRKQLIDDFENTFPEKLRLKASDEEVRLLKRQLERMTQERNIPKKARTSFVENQE